MTALDQAFIKAYVQQSRVPAPAIVDGARAVPLAEAIAERPPAPATVPTEVRRLLDEVKALEPAPVEQEVGLPDAEAVEALVADPATQQPEDPPEAPEQAEEQAVEPEDSQPEPVILSPPSQQARLSVADLEIPASVCCLGPEGPAIPASPAAVSSTAGADPETETEPEVEDPNTPSTSEPPPDGEAESAASPPPAPFRPRYQTDRFDWPEVCRTLDTKAEAPIGQLADALEAGGPLGRKVVGLGGLRPGVGCTTMLLCAARELARRGLKVLIVGADAEDPRLAERLGLDAVAGWQDVAAGRVALDEAVIESDEDGLAVLPLRGRGVQCGKTADRPNVGPSEVQTLRDAYDLVLVDFGPLAGKAGGPAMPLEAAGGAVDAIVLVHDARSASSKELVRLQRRLAEAGIAQAGVAENFVPLPEKPQA